MLASCDDGLADNVREVGPHHKIHRHSCSVQRRTGQKTSSHTKKPAQHSDHKTDSHQIQRVDMNAGNREIHSVSIRGLIKASSAVVNISSRKPWPIIKPRAMAAYQRRLLSKSPSSQPPRK